MNGEGAIEGEAAPERGRVKRSAIRCGRPPRELAGKVEERILDAAGKVFLERGFSGASVDEIAEVACAGKPTIYARFRAKRRCSRPSPSASRAQASCAHRAR